MVKRVTPTLLLLSAMTWIPLQWYIMVDRKHLNAAKLGMMSVVLCTDFKEILDCS